MKAHKIEMQMTVPFHDVDSMGVVWHGRYVKYLEVARCKLLDDLGFGYAAMMASEYFWPVVDMRVQYTKPLFFEQHINVVAEIVEWEFRLKIKYAIYDVESQVRLTKGYTIQVAVDKRTKEMCLETPTELLEKLNANN